MKQLLALVLFFTVVVISQASGVADHTSSAQEKGTSMKGSHVHLGVKDLPAALQWLDKVWQLRPTFQDQRMASLPFGEVTIILEASAADTPATMGFDSQNCDEDFRSVRSRGGIAIEEPRTARGACDRRISRVRGH